MRLTIPGSPRRPAVRPAIVGPGRLRKVGILGGSPHGLRFAPWNDPSWEFWTHSSCVLQIPYLRADRIFDLHPPHCFQEERKNGFKDYYGFLKSCPTPVYMQRQYPEIPQSRAYPYEMMKMLWPGIPFGSQCAYMIALALYEGVTHLGFFGISYAHETEYAKQRSNAERWVGIAEGLGVHIILPPDTPFCREPYEDYAYQSHDTVEKYAAMKAEFLAMKRTKLAQVNPFNKATLKPLNSPEAAAEAARLRAEKQPEWVKQVAKFTPEEDEPDWVQEATRLERMHDQPGEGEKDTTWRSDSRSRSRRSTSGTLKGSKPPSKRRPGSRPPATTPTSRRPRRAPSPSGAGAPRSGPSRAARSSTRR